MRLWAQKGELLSIREKDIDIAALSMIDLKHHCSPTAERPTLYDLIVQVDLADQRTRYSK